MLKCVKNWPASASASAASFINNHFFAVGLFGMFTKLFGATNPRSGNDIMLGAIVAWVLWNVLGSPFGKCMADCRNGFAGIP